LAKDKNDEIVQTDLIVSLDFEKDGTLKSLRTELEAGEEEFAGRLVPHLLQVAQNPSRPPVPLGGPTLFEEIERYLNEQALGGEWSPQTAADARGDFEQFKAILGDLPVAALSHEPLNKLKDTLLKLPANINKMPQTRGRSVEEILALGLPPQSPLTVKKKWDRVTSFLGWLEGKGLIEKNFAKGKKPKARAQSYEKFTQEDLDRLFGSPEYRTGSFSEPFQYWLPVLGLYTGARLEELAQLHLADIHKTGTADFWSLEITEEIHKEAGAAAEKTLKTKSSRRLCPIHTSLIDAGLLAYIDDLKRRSYDRLFPELRPDMLGKVSGRASEWFTTYRRDKGVGELTGKSRKNFHSFRHTMNSSLQRAGVSQEIREALCGHAASGINVRVYGGGLSLTHLRDAIQKLDFQLALPPFVPTDLHERARSRATRRD
jgi:integrase